MNSNQIMNMVSMIADKSGKNDKQELLALAMEDPTFAKVMNYTYNPFITFGVRPSRLAVFDSIHHETEFDFETWNLLDFLKSRELTGDAAKNAIISEMTRLGAESRELLWRILNKDMKAGFSESSINKVSKDFIPSTPYMRCSLPKDVDFEKWPWARGVISQIKADGMFFNANVEKDSVDFTSRQGQPFPVEGFEQLMEDFAEAFRPLLGQFSNYESGIQTHGEMLVKDPDGELLPREVGNGLINKLIKGTPLPEGHSLFAELWDIIPKTSAVKKGFFAADYLSRLRTLNGALGYVKAKRQGQETSIQVIETKVVRSYGDAMEHYYAARRAGLEGTIAKKTDLQWKDGTSKDQVKLKQEVPVELEVYGFEEGKEGGKTANTFGSLKCRSKCGMLEVNVGSGFSDELRKDINDNRDDWTGAIITVKANEIMYAKRGKLVHSLFLPIFVERRFDKTEADTFEQIVSQFENAVKAK